MQIHKTLDGSTTITSPQFPDQHYHSTRGALGESLHTYIQHLTPGAQVLEIGFGTGLNALLTAQYAGEKAVEKATENAREDAAQNAAESAETLHYTTIELYPIPIETLEHLSFDSPLLRALHTAPWGTWTTPTPHFHFRKLQLNIEQPQTLPTDSLYTTIFFDAFAPDAVPLQWTAEVFSELHQRLAPGGKLLTYSAKGTVKQALRTAGFAIKRLPGALGKHNMILATKTTTQCAK